MGEVVGVSYPSLGNSLGGDLFVVTKNGIQSLGSALNLLDEEDFASSINGSGVIVGDEESVPSFDAWVYKPGAGFTDLNADIAPNSGWILNSAAGVNDSGQIVGIGTLNGQQDGFLLTPVPEPGSGILCALLLAGIGASVKRRQLRQN